MKCRRIDTENESRITLEGSFDAHTASEVRPVFDSIVPATGQRVVVDIDKVTMIDSYAIGMLVGLAKRVKGIDAGFAVVGVHDQPLMVIKLLKLEALFSCQT